MMGFGVHGAGMSIEGLRLRFGLASTCFSGLGRLQQLRTRNAKHSGL